MATIDKKTITLRDVNSNKTFTATDESVKHIASMKHLLTLNIQGTKITEPAAKRLAEALPRCWISYGDRKKIEPRAQPQ